MVAWAQDRRAERQQAREARVKQLGGVLRKDSTPGMPLALAIASSMTAVQTVRKNSLFGKTPEIMIFKRLSGP
jgi:hypothetical protein